MEKIQIQFNESDYKIYYNYCSKYYQVHDVVRKQSIHAFLDFYEKGMIQVEEQDLSQASLFLVEKCDILRQEQGKTPQQNAASVHLRIRMCSDLLLFVEDLEKIFRLLKKQGVVANYLMILGTFSRIIEEYRSSPASGLYSVKNELIEALAIPLSETIQMRLGTDRQWQSVVRELTFIATRFNQKFTEPEFDREIVQLVGPAVVAHFNRDVETRDVLTAISDCYDESELEEFECLLNRTPEVLKIDQETDIDWEAITRPLADVVKVVDEQRNKLLQSQSMIADPYSLTNGSAAPSSRKESPSIVAPFPFPANLPEGPGHKVFDIGVSSDASTRIDSPITVYPEAVAGPVKSVLKPYLPIIVGFAIIVLFIVGTMMVSGDWKPFGGAGNTTNITAPGTLAQVTTAATKPPATTIKTTAPTPTPVPAYSNADIGTHLTNIAFGPDNNVIKKPTKDLVSLAVGGSNTASDLDHISDFITRFNAQSSTVKIGTNIDTTSQGDITCLFLPNDAMKNINYDENATVVKDPDTGKFYFIRTDEKTYINSEMTGTARKRWVLRAILINLGFYGESAKYPDSLFYTDKNTAITLSAIDWKAIHLMYGQKVKNGMTLAQVEDLY